MRNNRLNNLEVVMHKLKNKRTGEVITTPYMAEVEEYLNIGDYEEMTEMSAKDYYQKQMKKHFKLYEHYVNCGDKEKMNYHMQEYLNYESMIKACK